MCTITIKEKEIIASDFCGKNYRTKVITMTTDQPSQTYGCANGERELIY